MIDSQDLSRTDINPFNLRLYQDLMGRQGLEVTFSNSTRGIELLGSAGSTNALRNKVNSSLDTSKCGLLLCDLLSFSYLNEKVNSSIYNSRNVSLWKNQSGA
jgi:hypothetical protein